LVAGEPESVDPPERALAQRPPTELVKYIEEPRSLISGNAVRLLRNGAQAFPAWLAAIENARQRISMEMYIFADDKIGQRFADALCRAAQRGVSVRLLYDFIGCRFTSPAFFQRMRRAGVHTIVYHAYRFWRPRFWTLFRRNHRKTLVCDGQIAFTGGLNIADEWLPREEGGGGWLDSVVEVRGPAVPVLEAGFLRVWNKRSRRRFRLDPRQLTLPAAAGPTPLAVVANTELLDRFAIRRAALHALRESKARAFLANPYFVPDRGFLRGLCQAAARGVDVRLLVPQRSDTRLLDYAARATFPNLLRAGVRIFQHRNVVHSKALLVDDDFVSIGSYNLDHWSLAYNLEVVVNTLDREYHAEVKRMLEEDMAGAEEIHLSAFESRPLVTRILERLAYKLRLWL
jgi:cardiolipin synthase